MSWRNTVSNRSMPWKTVEIDSILKLRGLVIDMLVSEAEQRNMLRLRVVGGFAPALARIRTVTGEFPRNHLD